MAKHQRGGVLPSLADAAASIAEDRPRIATFIRGATIGALVGAAVAGTALLNRRARPGRSITPTDVPPGS
jgi:hypothetical protein